MEKNIFGTYTSYSQASSGDRELQELDFETIKQSTVEHCEYHIGKIKIRVYLEKIGECIGVDVDSEVKPLANFNLLLEFYYINDDNFYLRNEIERENIVYIASTEHFIGYSNNDMQLYALDTSLHEAFHYLYMRSTIGKKITSDREEFLANIYAYSLLKTMYADDSILKNYSYLNADSAKTFPKEIATSFSSELTFLEYISKNDDYQKVYDEILGLINR
ncbi:hypothetical protein KUL49_23090 [Alteromonas sp. KUL49]|nr:hypothetical protein KUL49_23090 [Alteromonas sp. KUL49]